MLEVCKFA